MDVFSRSRRLAKTYNTKGRLTRKYGSEMAEVIRRRLDDLRAADCLEDLRHAPGRCHELTGDQRGVLSIDLRGPYRLLFTPVGTGQLPRKQDGGLDWERVDAVEILEVRDTHGK